jgi:hypothetical protein
VSNQLEISVSCRTAGNSQTCEFIFDEQEVLISFEFSPQPAPPRFRGRLVPSQHCLQHLRSKLFAAAITFAVRAGVEKDFAISFANTNIAQANVFRLAFGAMHFGHDASPPSYSNRARELWRAFFRQQPFDTGNVCGHVHADGIKRGLHNADAVTVFEKAKLFEPLSRFART